jgi:tetratricopeptide (TPR) repeat protein
LILRQARDLRVPAGWLALLLMLAAPAGAASLDQIRVAGDGVRSELRSLGGAGRGSAEAERGLVERLGNLVLGFIEQSDHLARGGAALPGNTSLTRAFEAVHGPLDDIYRTHGRRLEQMAKSVMDEDGDLEALYDSGTFQDSQAVAASALYYLNWLDYYGARLFEGARRKELLEAAERGFSEFAVGEHPAELRTESLLGRGLCHLELGKYDWATRDFKAVIDDPKASPERAAKARLALLDAYARAGRTQDALRYSEELLRGGRVPSADQSLVRFQRLELLFAAIAKSSGAAADRYRREAGTLMAELRRAGKGWAERVDELMLARADDPSRWVGQVQGTTSKWTLARLLLQKEDYKQARPLLEDVLADAAGEGKPYRAEAHYWLGVASFKEGDLARAAEHFDAALAESAESFAAEASYLRFKALEALVEKDAKETLHDRYVQSLRQFLERHANHPHAGEARYRLGEALQGEGKFGEAIEQYAKVQGDAAFRLRAAFATVQCLFEQWKAERNPAARDALLARTGAALETFWQQAGSFKPAGDEAVLVQNLTARATLLDAVRLSLQPEHEAEVAARLADFAERFPADPLLIAQASRLRLRALRTTGQFEEAEAEVERNGAALAAEGRADAVDRLAAGFVKAGARRAAAGDAAGARAPRRTALGLYRVLDEIDGGPDPARQLVMARLEETTGDLAAAEKLYAAVLIADQGSLAGLEGLARVAEARGDRAAALGHWERFAAAARPGDAAWYRGRYEEARLRLDQGEKREACRLLADVRGTITGLRDPTLRERLGELQKRCK